MHSEEEICIL